MKRFSILLISSFFLLSCYPADQTSQTEVVNIYATSAAQPWLTELYVCAENLSVVLNVNADAPDIYLQIGEPGDVVSPVFQIDETEILIVTNRESSIQNLSLEEAQLLFAQGNPAVQVWVYASDADMQIVFDQLVMKGRSVTSFAQIAVSAQNMSDLLNSESSAVGILSKHWVTGTVREVFSVGRVPVLAITKEAPQRMVAELLSCLQSN